MECRNCGGTLRPNHYIDKKTGNLMVSGLTCRDCLKNEVTSDMTLAEYDKVVDEYYKNNKIV